jgi:CBS domain containing-hemolysin-like protein
MITYTCGGDKEANEKNLTGLRRVRKHMAIVLDEYGGTAGLVTSEELAEEVVGRLTDEWVDEPPQVAAVGGDAFEIDAQSRIDEVNEALGVHLPLSPDYETVAGFILFQIRHIPKVGEVIQFGSATPGAGRNLRLTVSQMIGPKIERLQVELVEPETRGSEPDG